MDCSADRHSYFDHRKLGYLRNHSCVRLNSMAAEIGVEGNQPPAAARLTLPIENAAGESLAADMIEVHGAGAAAVARDNARSAARAAQIPQAKAWINVLGIIQRLQSQRPTAASLFVDPKSIERS
jgi:hypothetical protein